jgi:hypothetical protein
MNARPERIFFTDRDLGIRFGDILSDAGIRIERLRDHFEPDTPAEIWLQEVGARGWVAITHNSRIRYTPNELAAVMKHRVALLVVIGAAPYAKLARAFVKTYLLINQFEGLPAKSDRGCQAAERAGARQSLVPELVKYV